MQWKPPQRLEGEGVVLRPLSDGDVDAYARWFVDDPTLGISLGLDEDPDAAAVRDLIQRSGELELAGEGLTRAIADPATDRLLGALMVHSVAWPHRRCEVGFAVGPNARGRGVAKAGLGLIINWLFAVLAFERIEMTTTPDNESAVRLAARVGFVREGLLRSRDIERGRRVDIVWFGLLRNDWHP